MHDLSVFCC